MGLLMLDMTKSNQFGLIYMDFFLQNNNIGFIMQEQVLVNLYNVQIQQKQNYKLISIVNQIGKQDNKIYWNPNKIYQDQQKQKYLSQMVGYINQFEHQNLFLELTFNFNISKYSNLKKMNLQVNIVNQKYTQFSIVVRLFYFFISSIVSFFFIKNLFKNSFNLVSIQQKIIAFLSILLIMFNDPLYAVTVLYPNWFSSFLSVFFVVNFIVAIFFTSIIFLDRIVYQDGRITTQQLKVYKFIWLGFLYVCLLIIYQLYANDQLHENLIFSVNQIYQNKYLVLLIFTLILFGIGVGYIAIQYVRIFINFKNKMWRNKILSIFTLFFILLVIVMFFIGSFQLYQYHSSRLLIIYAALNLYIFSLQFLFSSSNSQNQLQNRHSLNQINQAQFQEVIGAQSKEVFSGKQKQVIIQQQPKIDELNSSNQSRKRRKRKIDRKIKQSKTQEFNQQSNTQKQI